MKFNEDSRVKIPALLHLTRLSYTYLSRKEHVKRNEESNIFPELFLTAIAKINPGVAKSEIEKLLEELILKLDYDDLGKAFYTELTKTSGIKLIDFQNFNANSFHVTGDAEKMVEEKLGMAAEPGGKYKKT